MDWLYGEPAYVLAIGELAGISVTPAALLESLPAEGG